MTAPERSAAGVITNAADWHRIGGHRFDFFATDQELQDWLVKTLPPPLGPWQVLGHDPIREASKYVWVPFRFEVTELARSLEPAHGQRRLNLWLWSPVLTPGLNLRAQRASIPVLEHLCAVNGLVCLKPVHLVTARDAPEDDAWDACSLSVAPRWVFLPTGEEVVHEEYKRVYGRLKRAVSRLFTHGSIYVWSDGTERCFSTPGWTSGAVHEHEAGKRFAAPGAYWTRPGPRTC